MPTTHSTIPADCTIAYEGGYQPSYVVTPIWDGVDRPIVHRWSVMTRQEAERLQAAVLAGAAYSTAEIKTDVNGKTYVASRSEPPAPRCSGNTSTRT